MTEDDKKKAVSTAIAKGVTVKYAITYSVHDRETGELLFTKKVPESAQNVRLGDTVEVKFYLRTDL